MKSNKKKKESDRLGYRLLRVLTCWSWNKQNKKFYSILNITNKYTQILTLDLWITTCTHIYETSKSKVKNTSQIKKSRYIINANTCKIYSFYSYYYIEKSIYIYIS